MQHYAPGMRTADRTPDEAYHERWLHQLVEVVDQYTPDLIWFDHGLRFIRDGGTTGRTASSSTPPAAIRASMHTASGPR